MSATFIGNSTAIQVHMMINSSPTYFIGNTWWLASVKPQWILKKCFCSGFHSHDPRM
jgi:hypothetical protein